MAEKSGRQVGWSGWRDNRQGTDVITMTTCTHRTDMRLQPPLDLISASTAKALGFKLNILTGRRHKRRRKSASSGLSHAASSCQPLHCHVATIRTIIVIPLRQLLHAALAPPLIKRRIKSRMYTWRLVCQHVQITASNPPPPPRAIHSHQPAPSFYLDIDRILITIFRLPSRT